MVKDIVDVKILLSDAVALNPNPESGVELIRI